MTKRKAGFMANFSAAATTAPVAAPPPPPPSGKAKADDRRQIGFRATENQRLELVVLASQLGHGSTQALIEHALDALVKAKGLKPIFGPQD